MRRFFMRSRYFQRALSVLAVVTLGGGLTTGVGLAQRGAQQQVKTLPAPNKAFDEFKEQIQKYVDLRTKVESSLPKIVDTSDPKKLADRAAALAGALQAARREAKQGDIFKPAIAAQFRKILAADAASRTAKDKADIMEEVPAIQPRVNALYPTDSPQGPTALASVPAKLLQALPQLPDVVDYRFMGRTLILRDVIADLIIDYLPDVAPVARGRRP
jgi:hypothetical protein